MSKLWYVKIYNAIEANWELETQKSKHDAQSTDTEK